MHRTVLKCVEVDQALVERPSVAGSVFHASSEATALPSWCSRDGAEIAAQTRPSGHPIGPPLSASQTLIGSNETRLALRPGLLHPPYYDFSPSRQRVEDALRGDQMRELPVSVTPSTPSFPRNP